METNKLRIGIFFGGKSREREVSFAGGRTVFDNLNKSLFEPVPLFVDAKGNFILLNWQFIYKGSIRDFFPPVNFLPESKNDFQIYHDSLLELSDDEYEKMVSTIGKRIKVEELYALIDFAFLCLHGPFGEDGKLQGLLEYMNIPYSGSGIISSAFGIDKAIQKSWMKSSGFAVPEFLIIPSLSTFEENSNNYFKLVSEKVGFPCVVKSASQGSSIGVTILKEKSEQAFSDAVKKSFFKKTLMLNHWERLSEKEKVELVRITADIREGLGMPLLLVDGSLNQTKIYHPEQLIIKLDELLLSNDKVDLLAYDGEQQVIVESFIKGKEFSCIVIEGMNSENPISLPPTEIVKKTDLFDYRSKYLPGLSNKITPINIDSDKIKLIRKECEKLFSFFKFDVYARIDGFITEKGEVFLNDPNTTSGMMPSSFFFHQAAEIGLNPSQFLSFIIYKSLEKRIEQSKNPVLYKSIFHILRHLISLQKQQQNKKKNVAVILGGYSSERHISVESGRNIYEKLSSSEKYSPTPVFLYKQNDELKLVKIPVNFLLKDNADDIKQKIIKNENTHTIIKEIIDEAKQVTSYFSDTEYTGKATSISFDELKKDFDAVFIALHGRPGEDGELQSKLEALKIPYNGSTQQTSAITINKYNTNEILMQNGFSCAKHLLVSEEAWNKDMQSVIRLIEKELSFPFIAKPVDDGCSSAVRKIKNQDELSAFANLIFRREEALNESDAAKLNVKINEEFPQKKEFLAEQLIGSNGATHFLEITIGMLTKFNNSGEIEYEIFEASEALSEGEILSLEEKFLAGQGQNITPARFSTNIEQQKNISEQVKTVIKNAAKVLNIQGYSRIDAFVRIYENRNVEVVFIEVNSLPGMTPATCIFHQTAIQGYTPYQFIDRILEFGIERNLKI